MRTSSPVPDSIGPDPYTVPDTTEIGDGDVKNENEFASLGTSQRYPEIVAYLRERQEFYRKYLPDGTAIINIPDEQAGQWWKCAATLIAELDAFINIVGVSADAVRQSGRR